MKFYSLIAVVALVSAHKLNQSSSNNVKSHNHHACDYVDDKGDEIETSLAVQLESKMSLGEGETEPEQERVEFMAKKLGIEFTPELM